MQSDFFTGAIRLCDLTDVHCLKSYYCKYKVQRPFISNETKGYCLLHNAHLVSVPDRTSFSLRPCQCPPLCNNVDYDVQSSAGDFKAKEFQITPLL
jgi:hypothetical protein